MGLTVLEPVSRGQLMNCSLSHFRVRFKRETVRLTLGANGGPFCCKTHFIQTRPALLITIKIDISINIKEIAYAAVKRTKIFNKEIMQ